MRASRIPVLVMVVAALVLAVLAVRTDDTGGGGAADATTDVRELGQVAADPDALSSTWFCAAGSAGDITVEEPAEETVDEETADEEPVEDEEPAEDESPDGEASAEEAEPEAEPTGPVRAEHVVTVTNLGEDTRHATVSVHPGREEPVVFDLEVAASSSQVIELADHAQGPAVAALVEADGGDVVVSHQLEGDHGIDSGPCASTSSDVWHFAWGDTSRDSAEVIAIFNPFPGDAVVDLRFSTDEGVREPRALTGLVVPGRSVIVADVSAEVTRRDQVSTTLTTRSGRVVAERIQVADGSQRDGDLPSRLGLAVDVGTPEASLLSTHPYGYFGPGAAQDVVVYNPSDVPAEVDVELALGDDVVGGVEPFELSIRPGGFERIRLPEEPRLQDVFGQDSGAFSITVRSVNGVAVVSEVVTTLPTQGLAASPGGAVVGTSTVFGSPLLGEPRAGVVSLGALDADGPTAVTLAVLTDGEREVVEEIELDAGARVEVDLEELDLPEGAGALLVESSSPVAAELVSRWRGPDGYSIRTGAVRADGALAVFDLLS